MFSSSRVNVLMGSANNLQKGRTTAYKICTFWPFNVELSLFVGQRNRPPLASSKRELQHLGCAGTSPLMFSTACRFGCIKRPNVECLSMLYVVLSQWPNLVVVTNRPIDNLDVDNLDLFWNSIPVPSLGPKYLFTRSNSLSDATNVYGLWNGPFRAGALSSNGITSAFETQIEGKNWSHECST